LPTTEEEGVMASLKRKNHAHNQERKKEEGNDRAR